ncbi:MAG: DUF4129 domain-containing protein [Planctomycetota bacterium]|jgi:hypothetical protein
MEAEPFPAPLEIPSPDVIRRTAEEVIQRPDYNLDAVYRDYTPLIERIVKAIATFLRPFRRAFEALYLASPLLAWLFIVALLFIAVALIVHIAYTFGLALQGRRRARGSLELEDETAARPELWEGKAGEAAALGDFIRAVRCLFRACLLRLEAARGGNFRRGATNREYLRRFGDTAASEPLHLFVETIDTKWYGGGTSTRDDYERCLGAHSAVARAARDMTDAEHA